MQKITKRKIQKTEKSFDGFQCMFGSIAVAIAIVPCVIAILLNKDFIYYAKRLFATFKGRGNKKVVENVSAGKNTDDGETTINKNKE